MATAQQVEELFQKGLRPSEIASRLGRTRSAISHHLRKFGHSGRRSKYAWDKIQAFYDTGNTLRMCMREFGFSWSSWWWAKKRGIFHTRPQATPLKKLLVAGSASGRGNIKARLIKEGMLKERCKICAQRPVWRGKRLVLILDHKNGVKNDYRLSNLRLLCQNCNSQTDTFSGRNVKALRRRSKVGP